MEAREIDVEMTAWDERELLRRCRAGSEAAYAELVRRYRPRLYRIAYRLTNSVEAAEDAVQETFLAAFRA
ncbi:MAG TPA: sigma factor, partial [Candidatus Limnocylindrales bacterium]|nr:sigma factor [Candidatus Limnocylindrales bacterium]